MSPLGATSSPVSSSCSSLLRALRTLKSFGIAADPMVITIWPSSRIFTIVWPRSVEPYRNSPSGCVRMTKPWKSLGAPGTLRRKLPSGAYTWRPAAGSCTLTNTSPLELTAMSPCMLPSCGRPGGSFSQSATVEYPAAASVVTVHATPAQRTNGRMRRSMAMRRELCPLRSCSTKAERAEKAEKAERVRGRRGKEPRGDVRITGREAGMVRVKTMLAAALMAAMASLVWAQSPSATASGTINGKSIAVRYSAPSVRGRQIFGAGGLLSKDPTYPAWRAGANSATTLTTDADLMVGTVSVPKGTYTLYAWVQNPDAWDLIINKQTGQWGLMYDAKQDLGRVKMTMSKPPKLVETLKYSIADKGAGKGELRLEWEHRVATVPITVK